LPSTHLKPLFELPPVERRPRLSTQLRGVPHWICKDLQRPEFNVCSTNHSHLMTADLYNIQSTQTVLECDTTSTSNLAPSASVLGATTSAVDLPLDASKVLPNARRLTSSIAIQPVTQHLASNTVAADGGDCYISLLSPSSGSTSGREQIALVVANLPPSITLFARFGNNVVATVRYRCSNARDRPNCPLVVPRSWGPRLQPSSSRSPWYSRGHPLSNALSRCTHLRKVTGHVQIRVRYR
jgi:hypothetical protein